MSLPSSAAPDSTPFSDTDFVEAVNEELARHLSQQEVRVAAIAAEGHDLIKAISALCAGGKRVRPLFAWYGWQVAGGSPSDDVIVKIGVALELFQAAALIHDDILDRSDTRRNQPSAHRRFQHLHQDREWEQDGEHFGISAAILAGDVSLALSEELFSSVILDIVSSDPAVALRARSVFDEMRFEVMTGQYLDIREEAAGSTHTPEVALDRAMTILQYKSAKYSVQRPLMIGAAAAGADDALLNSLAEIGLPLGEAFQLRDDQLGVFGDPEVTGKPSGDDLREGKRTALIAYARSKANQDQSALISNYLGVPDLSDEHVAEFQDVIAETGAKDKVEELIAERAQLAFDGIAALQAPARTLSGLKALANLTINREK